MKKIEYFYVLIIYNKFFFLIFILNHKFLIFLIVFYVF